MVLTGDGLVLVYDHPIRPSTNWTSYVVPLNEALGWRRDSLSGRLASHEEFVRVMNGVTSLRIRGEFRDPVSETGYIDSVGYEAPSTLRPLAVVSDRITVGVVRAANTPPTITPVSDIVVRSGESFPPVSFRIHDLETDATALVVTVASSNPEVFATRSVVLSGVGNNRVATFPVSSRPGVTSIHLSVMDAAGAVSTSEFKISVVAVNQPPTVELLNPIEGQNVTAGATVLLDAVALDPEARGVIVDFFVNGQPIGSVFEPPYTMEWSSATPGSFSFMATATDELGLKSSSSLVNVVVLPVLIGQAPTITVQPQSHRLFKGTAYRLEAAATGSTPLHFQWLMNGTNLPGAFHRTLVFPSVQKENAGFYSVRVTNAFGMALSQEARLIVGALGEELWSFETKGEIHSSPSIGPDGTVYTGSDDGFLYALSGFGDLKWMYMTGGKIRSSAAVGANGVVYVGSFDGKLHAIRPDGSRDWDLQTQGEIYATPSIGSDGTIYVGSYDNRVHAVSAQGALRWAYETGNTIEAAASIATDGTVYVGSSDGILHAIRSDGIGKWRFDAQDRIITTPAIDAAGNIYFGALNRKLYCLGKDGTKRWEFTSAGAIRSSPTLGLEGQVHFGTDDGRVYAVTRDGRLNWVFSESPGLIYVQSAPALAADGTVYVGTASQKFYAINPQGKRAWDFPSKGQIYSSPALDHTGVLYFGSLDKRIYALLGASGLAETDWPVASGSNRRSGLQRDQTRVQKRPYIRTTRIGLDGNIFIEWDAELGRNYVVERSPNLGAVWVPIRTVISSSNIASFSEPYDRRLGTMFYRVSVP